MTGDKREVVWIVAAALICGPDLEQPVMTPPAEALARRSRLAAPPEHFSGVEAPPATCGTLGLADPTLSYWDTGYSDLLGVAWGGDDDTTGRAEIFVDPAPGYEITVSQFQLGAWPNTDRTTQVSVLDGLDATLFASAANSVISGAASTTFAGPWSSANGVRIQWGPSAFNVGIDNIVFDVALAGGATPVPLPAPLALLATGLLGLAALRRRA